jgi:RecB family exonuclease
VRALARPPIELRQVDLARVIQVARRRKLDLVLGLTAASESPQVPPEARERIQRFLELHRRAADELDAVEPDVFIDGLIDRLGMRGRTLLAPEAAAERRESLAQLRALAIEFLRNTPRATSRDLAFHLAGVVPRSRTAGAGAEGTGSGAPAREARRAGAPGDGEPLLADDALEDADDALEDGIAPAPAGDRDRRALEETLQMLRAELLDSIARIGGRLGELRLDTDLDISHGVVRYLELLKVSALLQRRGEDSTAEAIEDLNARLLAAATPLQREIFQTSPLDDALLAAEPDARARANAVAPRDEPSLGSFLPRKGVGLALSASDIETYRSCPLRYKYARVLRIPSAQTTSQRFGIVVHQVLERYHSEGGTTLARLLELLDAGWSRAGLRTGDREQELRELAREALSRYHARLGEQDAKPIWFERGFSFRLGPHHLRGRVDRIDRLGEGPDAQYELIDYKTSRPKTAEQLAADVQLSLYALAAREDWELQCSRQAYYYVLDDVKVPVPHSDRDAEAVKEIVLEVGEGILAQEFTPTPSPTACAMCDYRIVCSAAEA